METICGKYQSIIFYNASQKTYSLLGKKVIFFVMSLMLMPLVAVAQLDSSEKNLTDKLGQDGIIGELYRAYQIVKETMIIHQTNDDKTHTDSEIYPEAVYVDEENEVLIVWLDPISLFDPLDEDDLLEELKVNVPIVSRYGFFIPGSTDSGFSFCPDGASPIVCYYWDKYFNECTMLTRTLDSCQQFADIISSMDYTPPILSSTAPADTISIDYPHVFAIPYSPNSDVNPCPTDANLIVCYYWNRYRNECLPISHEFCFAFKDYIISSGYIPPISSSIISEHTIPTNNHHMVSLPYGPDSNSDPVSCFKQTSALACYYWKRYVDECLPVRTHDSCQQISEGLVLLDQIIPTPYPSSVDADGVGIINY